MNLSICSYNVRGLGNKTKREKIFEWFKTKNFALCLLQETHSGEGTHSKWKDEWANDAFFCGQSNNSEGIGILMNKNLSYTIQKYNEIVSGRIQALELVINEKELTIINLYGPNNDNDNLFKTLIEYMQENNEKTFIIGGDFNTVLNESLDKKNGRAHSHKLCRRKINDMIDSFNLIDIWRDMHPMEKEYTWHSSHKPPIFCRLDYFLISDNLRNSTVSCNHNISYKSDHSPVSLNIDLLNLTRGPGYFKLNNSLLLEADYQEIIKSKINEMVSFNKESNPNTLWELIKGTVRNETIKYASNKQKNTKKQESTITKEIQTLNKQLTEANDTNRIETIRNELNEKNYELENITDTKLNGLILRSKANMVENNEKNSKYFASLEKKRSENKTLTRLRINDTINTNQKEILQETELYYKKLYDKKETQHSRFDFFDDSVQKLNETEKQTCEGQITDEECTKALKDMQNNKSPGSDGITVEFYKIFWKTIKQYYIKSINYSFESGSLTELQKQSIITLIPKHNKDITTLDNWRPISLLNVDYKMATKVIANRVKNVITKIIDHSQTGFIKGRYIGENIRLLFEIIDKAEEENKPGLIFFSDFEKAFDSIDHSYMKKCLKHFNFGNSFIKWVELFYSDAKGCVTNNGFLSNFFSIKRGVRQGCPLSPYLFIICIELLSHKIKSSQDIKGIYIMNKEFKSSLFADDASFLLDGSLKSFETLIMILDNFYCVSGLKLNAKKCQVLRIGSMKNSHIIHLKQRKFQWSSTEANALGMTFTTDKLLTFQTNLESKIKHFESCLKQWQHRKLTLTGKVTVIKNYALPKLIYVLTSLPNPSMQIIKRIERQMFEFIWDGKPEKIKRNILINNYDAGGLKMIDLETFIKSLKITWIKRFIESDENGILNKIYMNKLNPYGGKLLFECNYSTKDADVFADGNTFLKDVLTSWASCISKPAIVSYRNEILWNNNYIRAGGRTIMYKNWYHNGIKYLKDIYDDASKTIYSFDRLQELYQLPRTEFLNYLSLIQSIPRRWKTNLQHENVNTPMAPLTINQTIKAKQTNKFVYNLLLAKKPKAESKSEQKWTEQFQDSNLNWKNIYKNRLIATKEIKLQNFQYKFLMRIIPSNSFLLKCNIATSALCDFCTMEIESINHLFWECLYVQQFWTETSNFLKDYNVDISFSLKTVFFGITQQINNPNIQVKNFIILLAKYFIFRSKCQKIPLSSVHFKSYLRQRLKIEKHIYLIKDNLTQFEKKWHSFNALLD